MIHFILYVITPHLQVKIVLAYIDYGREQLYDKQWLTLNLCCAQVPSSYVSLQQAVLGECERLRKEDQPPVLNEEEFTALAKSDPKSDIHDAEELQLGEC